VRSLRPDKALQLPSAGLGFMGQRHGFLRLPIGEQPNLEVVTVHREPFVLVVPSSHKLAKRKRVRLGEVSGENFVMNERSYAPGFYDLIFGMLRDARIVPNVSQTAGELLTLISLVSAQMGVAIVPASAAKHSVASVVACDIVGDLPMSEIALVCDKRGRTPVVNKFRSFALEKLARVRKSLDANRSDFSHE
jgi:DNA-binding transcriptional LysR family regulator